MGYVYLIAENGFDDRYKIGSTKSNKADHRLKQLQTGNSNKLYLKDSFETDVPFKLEKMLHNHFKDKGTIGEWFELDKSDIKNFNTICEKFQKIIDSMRDNPFFF